MCNACGFQCCAWDGFSGCGCEHCDCPDCWEYCETCDEPIDMCCCDDDDFEDYDEHVCSTHDSSGNETESHT